MKEDLVVVKPVLLVPQPGAAESVHGVGDRDEMLEELRGHVFVGGIGFAGKFQGHGEHGRAIERHPGCAVGLLEHPAGRQRFGAVEDPDVVQTEKSAGERCLPWASLRLTHQVKLISSFWKTRSRKTRSRWPRAPVIL